MKCPCFADVGSADSERRCSGDSHAPAAAPSMSIIAQHPMIDQIALVTGCGAAEAIGFAVARCMETARGHAVTFLPSPPLHRMTSSH